MPKKVYAGVEVDVDEEGYMTNMEQWTPDIAREIAKELGIELTDAHWKVINYLREKAKEGEFLTLRKLGKSGLVSIKELYQLFPNGPLKKAAKIAGLPKPRGCV